MTPLERAIRLAVNSHAGQADKAGQPYILHPLRVMLAMPDDEHRIAAVLHDVVEDCDVALSDFRMAHVPARSYSAIIALTKIAGEAYQDYLHRVASNSIARVVKIADLKDNLSPDRAASCPPSLRPRYEKALAFLQE